MHDVDLDDPSVRHSPGLVDFVRAHGLLPDPDPAQFDFARAFGVLGVAYNTDREWLAQHLLCPSRQQPPGLAQYSLFLRPDVPVELADIMAVLRATYAGTPLEVRRRAPSAGPRRRKAISSRSTPRCLSRCAG